MQDGYLENGRDAEHAAGQWQAEGEHMRLDRPCLVRDGVVDVPLRVIGQAGQTCDVKAAEGRLVERLREPEEADVGRAQRQALTMLIGLDRGHGESLAAGPPAPRLPRLPPRA